MNWSFRPSSPTRHHDSGNDTASNPESPEGHEGMRNFALITSADFVVRSAYQMGKTPLLPIFAVTLGASDAFLGLIVSVSTLTGMFMKPIVGILSDRWGRRSWLLAGTAFFALMPFAYQFVETPGQLFAVRLIHGMATAIYGPVTLAYVAELSSGRIAERLGWFGTARNAGYVIGPAVAGWMLVSMSPVAVFTVIGLISTLAFMPVLLLGETRTAQRKEEPPLFSGARRSLLNGIRTPAIWATGAMEAAAYIPLYAIKVFVPVYALAAGVNVALVGTFFSLQAFTQMVATPGGGRLADRFGYIVSFGTGTGLLGVTLAYLATVDSNIGFLAPAVLIGIAQALILPAATAWLATSIDHGRLGTSLGLVGTMRAGGKVTGPVMAGLLIAWVGFAATLHIMGVMLVVVSISIWARGAFAVRQSTSRRRSDQSEGISTVRQP
jgi:MFS family permease